MDDSVELHAPRHAFTTKRPKSEESSKTKRSKTVASSSQPKSVASSISAAEQLSSQGSDHRRSRTPERRQRHSESPRHHSSRRDGHSSDRRERARPSSSGGSSSRRRAESSSVSKVSTPVRRALPLAIISIILRAIVDPCLHLHHGRLQTASLSPVTARDDERALTGRVGSLLSDGSSSYPLRNPRPLRNTLSQWLHRRLDRFILNRPQQFQSRPR